MNTDAPWPSIDDANARVLKIQTNLHRWSTGDANRRFDDLSNLVSDPAFLTVAWNRVKANRGRRLLRCTPNGTPRCSCDGTG